MIGRPVGSPSPALAVGAAAGWAAASPATVAVITVAEAQSGSWDQSTKRPRVQTSAPNRSPPSRGVGAPGPSRAKTPDAMRTPRAIRMLHEAASSSVRTVNPARTSTPAVRQVRNEPQIRVLVRNGYEYRLDEKQRTLGVSGTLTLSDSPARSRTTQARAGGADRRGTDDGGHYIAARFNGPTEAFNHFAQDRNFNRGGYRALEDKWAAATKDGKQVSVRITPSYDGTSNRPASIIVRFSIDGVRRDRTFNNEHQEKPRGK